MVTYYFDSSALVKAYASELGSGWMQQELDPAARLEGQGMVVNRKRTQINANESHWRIFA